MKQLKRHFIVHTAAFLTVKRQVIVSEKMHCSGDRVTAPGPLCVIAG